MTAREIIEQRMRYWRAQKAKAEGKYNSDSPNMDDKSRTAAMYQCQKCDTVLIVLQGILDEMGRGE